MPMEGSEVTADEGRRVVDRSVMRSIETSSIVNCLHLLEPACPFRITIIPYIGRRIYT